MNFLLAMQDFREDLAKDWYGQTVLHPLGFSATMLLGMLTLLVPRRFALLPMMTMACFVAPAQRVVIFGLDFNLLRVMTMFGWARILLRSEFKGFRWKTTDTVVVLWLFVGTVAYTIQTNGAGLTERAGWIMDAGGIYFYTRFVIRNWSDVRSTILGFAILAIPCAIVFLFELATGRNMFSVFGGVPRMTSIRQGKLRAQGAFAHPILAGCFWASVMPMMIGLYLDEKRDRFWMVMGVIGSLIVIYACRSSTPVLALMSSGLGASCYFIRRWLGGVLIALAIVLTIMHFGMRGPVWSLLAKTDVFAGSTGYHRYALFDAFINRASEWWMFGTPSTAHWGWGLHDVTNHYVFVAIKGGLLTLVLFLAIITLSFRSVGNMLRRCDRVKKHTILTWSIGVALFVHIMCFWSVSYFGQMILPWYITLGLVASLASVPDSKRRRVMKRRVRRGVVNSAPDNQDANPVGPSPASEALA